MRRLGHQIAEVDDFAFRHPLLEGAETATRDHDALGLAGSWVDDRTRLQIWHLAALGLLVAMADVVAGQWFLAGYEANFGHTLGIRRFTTRVG